MKFLKFFCRFSYTDAPSDRASNSKIFWPSQPIIFRKFFWKLEVRFCNFCFMCWLHILQLSPQIESSSNSKSNFQNLTSNFQIGQINFQKPTSKTQLPKTNFQTKLLNCVDDTNTWYRISMSTNVRFLRIYRRLLSVFWRWTDLWWMWCRVHERPVGPGWSLQKMYMCIDGR